MDTANWDEMESANLDTVESASLDTVKTANLDTVKTSPGTLGYSMEQRPGWKRVPLWPESHLGRSLN